MPNSSKAYLLAKAAAGERLYFNEGLQLYHEASLIELGMAANAARQIRVPGRIVTYLVDRNINYTNICNVNCLFCGFSRPAGHPDGFVVSREELSAKIDELVAWGGTRVLIQGGNHPDLPLSWYVDLLRWMRETYPTIELDCFSPTEISNIAKVSGLNTYETLKILQSAGLQGLPGGGAEILDDEIRHRHSPKKQKTDDWLHVMREAQERDLNTSATMVVGFDESYEHRMRHLQRLRDLQDYSLREHGNGFIAFISWTLQHSQVTSLGRSKHHDKYGATPHEYLRHAALCRLFLDNILHHQASWVTQGPKVAQVSLEFGLDDFGSTMLEENVVSVVAHQSHTRMTEAEIHALVRGAGYIPAKRDTNYNLLKVYDDPNEILPPPPPKYHLRDVDATIKAKVEILSPHHN